MNFDIHRCHPDFVRATVERDHYLRRWPDPRSLPFAYCLSVDDRRLADDGRPLGVMVYKKLQHHRQRGLFGYPGLPTAWQVLDLARVWVHPELQSVSWTGLNRRGESVTQKLNVFSRMVGLCFETVAPGAHINRLQRDWLEHHPPVYPELPYHIELVISYCEIRHHDGTGYRATNLKGLGRTQDGTKEIYCRRLKAPRHVWRPAQASLLDEAA